MKSVLSASLACVFGALFLSPAAHAQTSIACAVGEVALQRELQGLHGGPLVVSATPTGHLRVRSDVVFSGKPDAALPPKLAAAWNAAPDSRLFQVCPDLTKQLPAGWRYATAEEEKALQRPTIHFFGAPVVRGTLALIQVGAVCSGLCGTSYVALYRFEAGRWRYVSISAASMS